MKKKKKKGSLELSVNSIVILIMAIALLGLGLGFIKAKFSDLNKQLVTEEPTPNVASATEPITLSREKIVVTPGKQVALKVNMYSGTALPSAKPVVACSPLLTGFDPTKIQVTPKTINAGDQASYAMILSIPKAPSGSYLCQVCLNSCTGTGVIQKDFTIEIQ